MRRPYVRDGRCVKYLTYRPAKIRPSSRTPSPTPSDTRRCLPIAGAMSDTRRNGEMRVGLPRCRAQRSGFSPSEKPSCFCGTDRVSHAMRSPAARKSRRGRSRGTNRIRHGSRIWKQSIGLSLCSPGQSAPIRRRYGARSVTSSPSRNAPAESLPLGSLPSIPHDREPAGKEGEGLPLSTSFRLPRRPRLPGQSSRSDSSLTTTGRLVGTFTITATIPTPRSGSRPSGIYAASRAGPSKR